MLPHLWEVRYQVQIYTSLLLSEIFALPAGHDLYGDERGAP